MRNEARRRRRRRRVRRLRRAREGDRFFSSRHRRENLQKSRKRAARVLASRRGHRRAPARASQGEVRGGGVRLGAQPSRKRARKRRRHKKNTFSGGPRRGRPLQPGARAVRRVRPEKLRRHRLDLWSLVAARRVVAEQGRATTAGVLGKGARRVVAAKTFTSTSVSENGVLEFVPWRFVRRRVVLRPGVRRVGLAASPQTVRGCAVSVRAARRRRNSFGVRSRRARRVGGVSAGFSRRAGRRETKWG